MAEVRTRPDGVCTASAWVTLPVLWTVIVIVPVFDTAGLAGVILNSVSLRLTWPPAVLTGVLVAAGVAVFGALVMVLDEPQPAISAATANGASMAIRGISVLFRWLPLPWTPRDAETFLRCCLPAALAGMTM